MAKEYISCMNRAFILGLSMLLTLCACAQTAAERMAAYEQQKFCSNLNKVLESGRQEDFESLTDMNERQSSALPVPGYSIRLAPFDVVYVDKDRRFVGKTNENLDSLSAVKRLEQLKPLVANCLDSTWRWSEALGDDSTTVFFKEFKQLRAMGPEFTISLAMDVVAHNLYTVNLYIRKNRRK